MICNTNRSYTNHFRDILREHTPSITYYMECLVILSTRFFGLLSPTKYFQLTFRFQTSEPVINNVTLENAKELRS